MPALPHAGVCPPCPPPPTSLLRPPTPSSCWARPGREPQVWWGLAGVAGGRVAGGAVVAVNFPAPTAQQLGARHRQVRAGGEWRGDNNVSVVFQGRVASCKPQIPLTSSGESVTTDSGRRGCGGGRLFLNDFFRASFHRLFACACVHACSETRSSPLLLSLIHISEPTRLS